MKYALDLCSGTKSALAAFDASPEWEVVTVDIDRELNPTHILDLTDEEHRMRLLMLYPPQHFSLIWASPDCIGFYNALAPWQPDYGLPPDMNLVRGIKELIVNLAPDVWVIENTRSGSHFLNDDLGDWRQVVGPFFLYGNFPMLDARIEPGHKASVDPGPGHPHRSLMRAAIPLELSKSLFRAILTQSKLPI